MPCGGYHEGAHRAIALAGGVPQTPFSSGRRPVGDTPKPRRRLCLQPSHLTQPSLTIREGFEPLPKPLANPWQGDVIDYGQRPPFVKGFLYGSQSLCPFGASHGLFTSPLSPPLEKGLKERERRQTPKSFKREGSSTEETTSTAKASSGKGAQRERRQAPQKHQAGRVLNSPTTLNAGR